MTLQFDLQPTLTGQLLELRPLRPNDFDALFAAASDPLIWEQHPESDRYQREVFQKFFDGAIKAGDLLVTSSKAGYAMKGTNRKKMMGAVLGKALQPLPKGDGVIQVLVTLQ